MENRREWPTMNPLHHGLMLVWQAVSNWVAKCRKVEISRHVRCGIDLPSSSSSSHPSSETKILCSVTLSCERERLIVLG